MAFALPWTTRIHKFGELKLIAKHCLISVVFILIRQAPPKHGGGLSYFQWVFGSLIKLFRYIRFLMGTD